MCEFTKTLRYLVRLSGKSEYELAAASGLDIAYIRRLLSGEKQNPSICTIIRLQMALVADLGLLQREPMLKQSISLLLRGCRCRLLTVLVPGADTAGALSRS
jgi:transcriptional regulator with XRE-family HTH domain